MDMLPRLIIIWKESYQVYVYLIIIQILCQYVSVWILKAYCKNLI
jgi:hypothetical protein